MFERRIKWFLSGRIFKKLEMKVTLKVQCFSPSDTPLLPHSSYRQIPLSHTLRQGKLSLPIPSIDQISEFHRYRLPPYLAGIFTSISTAIKVYWIGARNKARNEEQIQHATNY